MPTRRAVLAALPALALPALALAPRPARADTPPVYAEGGVAIDGTDPTGYFTAGRPVPGDPAITLDWNGATWRFASAASRERFAADPERYAPQFGGWCAWAVSRGYTAATIPEAWHIEGRRLYLNASRRIQRRWERDIPGNIARAEANWPAVLR